MPSYIPNYGNFEKCPMSRKPLPIKGKEGQRVFVVTCIFSTFDLLLFKIILVSFGVSKCKITCKSDTSEA